MNDYDKGYRDGVNREIQHTKYHKEQSEFWHKAYDKLINSLSTPQMNEVIANLSGEGTEQTSLEADKRRIK